MKYQHAYNVLKAADLLPMAGSRAAAENKIPSGRPILTSEALVSHGFRREGCWSLEGISVLTLDGTLDRGPGVYAFALDGVVLYVGVATRCIANRLSFYRRPATSQRTNVRLNALLLQALASVDTIDVLVARPEPGNWNGLPVNTCAGLELGIINAFQLPWNQRV